MSKVAIIGCGAIGSTIAKAIDSGLVKAELIAIYDIVIEKCVDLSRSMMRMKPLICTDLECLLINKPDIVVEAASQEAVKSHVPYILEKGVDTVVLSVGALLDPQVMERIREASVKGGSRLFVPSGAVCGIDGLKALSIVGFKKVKLITRKNVKSVDEKSLLNLGYKPSDITDSTVVFKGSAEEAVVKLPFNINVAATLKLATDSEVEVEFIVDPKTPRTVHELIAESEASRIRVTVENVPHPDNPKTSYLAALSAISLLKRLVEERVVIGT
ncbi:MAG: aspartate dehydrogenase [Desulfurococcaceae archaeon]